MNRPWKTHFRQLLRLHDRTAAVYARRLLDDVRRQGLIKPRFHTFLVKWTYTWI